MSDGYWTEERRMMQQTAREFTTNEVLPVANALDPEKGLIPRELIEKMGEMGYFGITIPEQKGGLGLGAFEFCRGGLTPRPPEIPGVDVCSDGGIERAARPVRQLSSSHQKFAEFCSGHCTEPR